MNDFIEFSKDATDNTFRGEFTMETGIPQPQHVQYIPTVNGVPITPEKPSPVPVPPPVVVKAKPKQIYPSLMNKAELIECGEGYGLELTEDMTKKIMLGKIGEAKKNVNTTKSDKSVPPQDRNNDN